MRRAGTFTSALALTVGLGMSANASVPQLLTQQGRFRVYNPAGGTLTNNAGSCSQFLYTQISP